jgi:hypothetical protein
VSRIEIVPATIRDLTFIAANLRAEDWREIECQLADGVGRGEVAAYGLAGEAWVATMDGQPVAAFGAAAMAYSVVSVWAWGTKRMARTVPAITRFIVEDCVPRWIEAGVTRAEARSIEGHETAHRWLRSLGGQEQPCPAWGKRGEDFTLFWWTRKTWTSRKS